MKGERLKARFGERVSLLPHVRRLYGYDATGLFGLPDAVLYAESMDDLRDAVLLAHEIRLPIIGRGSGTGLSGGTVPEQGGIIVSFERLRRILSIDEAHRRIWVEAGIVNLTLESHLEPLGLFYPPDPASHRISTIGGNLAENSGGPRAVKYGVTGHHVIQLRVVDAGGHVGILSCGEFQPSLDLVSLVVGSEGTLALIEAAQLALEQRPEHVVTLLLSFRAMAGATRFVSSLIAAGTVPSTLEFMDRNTIRAIEEWGVATYPTGAGAVLLVDLDGNRGEIERESEAVRDLALHMGALDVELAQDEAEREALWLGRRGSYAAVARHSKRVLIQDVTVPRSRLTDMLLEVERIAGKYNLHTATVGHAGDGNLHPDFGYDPDDGDMVSRIHAANTEILQACVRMDGSITGEHGIGSDKLAQLSLMYGPAELGMMADVKRALDPDGILNPDKAILMELGDQTAVDAPQRSLRPVEREARDAVLAARQAKVGLSYDLDRLRHIQVDIENMVVEVGAGETIGAINSALSDTSLRFPVTALRAQEVGRALLLNDYGPDHLMGGLFRQHLLAVTYVTGRGDVVRMGRPVMKNVAGYDLFRLLIGSRGLLGVPLSFVFRLVPRRAGQWFVNETKDLTGLVPLSGPRAYSLYAYPYGENYRACGQYRIGPEGWEPMNAGEYDLAAAMSRLKPDDEVLDLAFPPEFLPHVLSLLSTKPTLVLPAAARILVHLERNRADELVRKCTTLCPGAVRATYGSAQRAMHESDEFTQLWEKQLTQVFDPDGVLREWLI
jgi:glycolate oxidase subunit GlcD